MTERRSVPAKVRGLRRWHSNIGVFAALFFVIIVATGLALNHTTALRLDSIPITSPSLMKWYGLKDSVPTQGYLLGAEFLTWDNQQWLLGTRRLGEKLPQPVGAIELMGLRYVATRSALFLYAASGQLIDRIEQASLPGFPIERLAAADRQVLVQTPQGVFASTDGMNWQAYSGSQPAWSAPQPLPAAARQALTPAYAPNLPLERIVLDLHSGRLFGRYGPLAVDLAALGLLVLALTGAWIYFQGMRRRRQAAVAAR